MQTLFLSVVAVLLLAVILWFFLCYKIFELLRTRYPEHYEAMGKPSLIMRNGSRQQFLLMKFVIKREWKKLNDERIAMYGYSMLVLYVVYVSIILFAIVFAMLNINNQ